MLLTLLPIYGQFYLTLFHVSCIVNEIKQVNLTLELAEPSSTYD